MFDKYHYTKQGKDFIIYEAKNLDKAVQMSLFKNDKLLESKTGLLGEFKLNGEDIQLSVKNSALKSTHELSVNGSIVELKKSELERSKKRTFGIWHI